MKTNIRENYILGFLIFIIILLILTAHPIVFKYEKTDCPIVKCEDRICNCECKCLNGTEIKTPFYYPYPHISIVNWSEITKGFIWNISNYPNYWSEK